MIKVPGYAAYHCSIRGLRHKVAPYLSLSRGPISFLMCSKNYNYTYAQGRNRALDVAAVSAIRVLTDEIVSQHLTIDTDDKTGRFHFAHLIL